VTPEQRIARAHRAQGAWDEFVAPVIEAIIDTYRQRIVDLANSELDTRKRADKLTALSNAIRIAENIRSGLTEAIRDGELANVERLKAEKVEKMTAPQRRLLGIAPY